MGGFATPTATVATMATAAVAVTPTTTPKMWCSWRALPVQVPPSLACETLDWKREENHIKRKLVVYLTYYWFQFSHQLGSDVYYVSNSAKFDEDNKTKTN